MSARHPLPRSAIDFDDPPAKGTRHCCRAREMCCGPLEDREADCIPEQAQPRLCDASGRVAERHFGHV
eukprot:scaffold284300_cov30-Tisochrysis_lutea.AAC.4